MAQNAMILAKLAQVEAALAEIRTLIADPSAAPPASAKAAEVVTATEAIKAGATPLTEDDLAAMVKAGVKAGAQVKTLGKAVFSLLSIPKSLWGAAREQWKEYRAGITDSEAKAAVSELVLTEEVLESLRRGTDAKTNKPFDAKTRTKKLIAEFADYEIHPALYERAGREWREWAEANGLGERATAPPQSSRSAPKSPKAALPALLSAQMLASIRESKDPKGRAFHKGSQKRMLAETLTGLGIAESDHARAAKEWKAYAAAEGIEREGSSKGSTKGSAKGSAQGSVSGSEGVPEDFGPEMAPTTPAPDSAAAAAPAAAASASASASAKVLTPVQYVRISDSFPTTAEPDEKDIRKVLARVGVPRGAFKKAVTEWREWAKENHRAMEEEDDDGEVDMGCDEP